jgi:hypothetical protein
MVIGLMASIAVASAAERFPLERAVHIRAEAARREHELERSPPPGISRADLHMRLVHIRSEALHKEHDLERAWKSGTLP